MYVYTIRKAVLNRFSLILLVGMKKNGALPANQIISASESGLQL